MRKPLLCPACNHLAEKAIYMGMPVKVCLDCLPSRGATVWGFWSFFMQVLPYNGRFLTYQGNYFSALWVWLMQDEDDWYDDSDF